MVSNVGCVQKGPGKTSLKVTTSVDAAIITSKDKINSNPFEKQRQLVGVVIRKMHGKERRDLGTSVHPSHSMTSRTSKDK